MRDKTKNHCKKIIFVTLLVATEKIVRIFKKDILFIFQLRKKAEQG
jgi:hypothetical protein